MFSHFDLRICSNDLKSPTREKPVLFRSILGKISWLGGWGSTEVNHNAAMFVASQSTPLTYLKDHPRTWFSGQ